MSQQYPQHQPEQHPQHPQHPPQQPGWGAPQPPAGFPPQPKKSGAGKIVGFGCAGLVGLFLVICVIGAVVGGKSDDPAEDTANVKPAATGTQDDRPAVTAEPGTAEPPSAPVKTEEPKKSRTEPADSVKKPSADTGAPETATLPDLVGQDLQAAQDAAQAAGFYVLDDQDASGQGRFQIYDRNWTVCSQDPGPGTHPTDTLVTLYAVKDDETC
ncbi:hypothetical protein AQJ30_09615 [Streptomyces longwoodensis]|uniref:PASTA domain-containing protein n=1 Tax=Streptomyces longwoodensis TaxID=68231 RepID=A0A101R0H0_9ACTN|nr:PASTA domain-containing protein [Streptomyces longwoodensis]KUN39436.1 hypothetical protein AQJ30_09615 [Streptomyces longwoodensis]